MKVLVTGGAGFIGSHLVERLLADGNEVSVVDDFNDFYDPQVKRSNLSAVEDSIQIHEEDIRDAAAVDRLIGHGEYDTIVHLAARAGVRPSISKPRLYLETNVFGTFNLLESARVHGVPRFVFASSSSVYGLIKEVPFNEEMCINQTVSPYAATKLSAEQLCSNYSHLYGIRCTCLRFFTVYGPRQRPDLAIHSFTRNIAAGRPIDQYGDGTTRRDYTYIDDITQGVTAALRYEGKLFDVFNLGESETTQLKDLIAHLEATLRKRARINRMPEQPGDVPLTYADITKAQRLLGYAPVTKISDGIPKFVEWFLHSEAGVAAPVGA